MKENNAILRLEGVGFKTDDAVILNNIDLRIAAGEFKLITGPSGCGKSTLLKIIASLLSPTSGEIFFNDKDIATLSPENYRQQVSYCAQTPALFGDSVYDNLVFPWQIRNKQPDPKALVADLERFGLADNTLMSFPAVKNSGSRSFVICSFYRRFCCLMKLPARWMKVISATLTRLFIATRRKKGWPFCGSLTTRTKSPTLMK